MCERDRIKLKRKRKPNKNLLEKYTVEDFTVNLVAISKANEVIIPHPDRYLGTRYTYKKPIFGIYNPKKLKES